MHTATPAQPQPISSTNLLANLNASIEHYQRNLTALAAHLQEGMAKDQAVKCKCRHVLGGSLAELKSTFVQFAEEWRI